MQADRLHGSREASTSGRGLQSLAQPAGRRCGRLPSSRHRVLPEPGLRSQRRAAGTAQAVRSDEEPLPYLIQEYSPESNAAYWELRPVTVLQRSLQIGLAFAGWFLSTRLRPEKGKRVGTQADRLRGVLTELGPAFVKIGQAVSSRPDIAPPSYTRELEKLQDKIPPFPDAEALRTLQQELGRPAAAVFADISPTAVAAASLGQVYKARLRDGGRAVAVKVQRPRVREAIALDVYIIRWLAGRARAVRRLNSDLAGLLDEWAGSLFRELDYRREAANGARFKQLYAHLEGIYIPDMLPELTTQRVLTMEWVDGVRLRSAGEEPGVGRALDPRDMRLVGYGVQCCLEQMLEDGFYHADPHPGNLLRTADGRLGWIDFGMVAEIDPKIRRGLMRATLHMVNREFQALADDFETLGLLPARSDKERVVPALQRVFESALAGGVANMSFSSLSGDLGRTMYEFSFRIPPYYTLLVRSLSVLEGIALSSDPNYKVLGAAYPWVARRLLTNSNPELQATLRSLLYKGGRFQFSRLESLLLQALRSPARAARGQAPAAAPGAGGEPATSGTGGRPVELLLGSEGGFVRQIVVDELAKGLDAAWRLAADDARGQLAAWLQSTALQTRWQGASSGAEPASALLAALRSLPRLADDADSYQVEGIGRLVAALQQVNGSAAAAAPATAAGPLPGRVLEAVAMLQWFAAEAQALAPPARLEALKLPAAVAAKLSGRVSARAVQALLARDGSSNGGGAPGRAAADGPQPGGRAQAPAIQV